MRITAEAKAETRDRIIEAAARLFTTDGWENTTTRGIAAASGIAAGTLFNYFETKEAIVAALMSEALEAAQAEVRKRRGADQLPDESLEEELFALIWTELKSLKEYRKFLPAAAETILSPMRHSVAGSPGESLRMNHLKAVEDIVGAHRPAVPLPQLTLQLYWTLYLGVFAWWAADHSPKQEDTLALLDHSLKLFVASLDQLVQLEKGDRHHDRQPERSHRRASARGKRRASKRR